MSGVFSIIFTILAFFLPPQLLRTVWVILAIVSCLLAIFSLVYSERRRADEAEEKLKQERATIRPALKGDIEQIFLRSILNLNSPTRESVGVQVFAKVTIYNESNCPTTTRSYDLTIENEQVSYPGERRGGVKAFILADEQGRQQESMPDLAAMTEIDPLVKGVLRRGWLLFMVKDIDAVTAARGKLKLAVVDVWGARHELDCSRLPVSVDATQMVGHDKFLLKRFPG